MRSWLQQIKAEAKELYTAIMERDLYGCSDSAALHALTDKAELAAEMKFNRLTLQYAYGEKEPELKHLCNWLKQRRPHYEQVFLASHPTAAFTEALNRHLNAGPTGPKTMDVDAAPARADNSQKSPGRHGGRPRSVISINGHLVRDARGELSQSRFAKICNKHHGAVAVSGAPGGDKDAAWANAALHETGGQAKVTRERARRMS